MVQLIAYLSFVASAFAGGLFDGLPQDIATDYPESNGFVAFGAFENLHAPLLSRPKLDGGDRSFSMADVFEEHFFAKLPEGQRIVVSKNAEGQDVWTYPQGTQVIHKILLRSEPRRIFELRILWQRPDGTWAYGLYAPKLKDGHEDDAIRLHLLKVSSGPVQIDADVKGYSASGPVRVTGARINIQSCQRCHYMISPGRYQYPNHDAAGPCGFVPSNPSINDWATRYRIAHGYWPFAPESR